MFYIKVRRVGDRAWWFLTSAGGTTRLRVHASRFPQRDIAEKLIKDNEPDNPDWEWKVVAA